MKGKKRHQSIKEKHREMEKCGGGWEERVGGWMNERCWVEQLCKEVDKIPSRLLGGRGSGGGFQREGKCKDLGKVLMMPLEKPLIK